MLYDASLIDSPTCVACGACCSVYVSVETFEVVEPDPTRTDVEIVTCPKLSTEGGQYVCTDYENRPAICREYHCLNRANRLGVPVNQIIGDRVKEAVKRVHGREIEIQLIT